MTASVRLHGIPAGTLQADRSGRLRFAYTSEWLAHIKTGGYRALAISARMPPRGTPYEEEDAGPFFDGMLPEARQARETLGRYFKIDASDRYNLLLALGTDCPGAVSITPLSAPIVDEDRCEPNYDVLSEQALATHIRDLPARPLFVDADDQVRLSLAGVHDKAAVVLVGGAIALAHGCTPTTHILKVDIPRLPNSAKVEHFCLKLASDLGLRAPRTVIRHADSIPYLLVSRYDRVLGEVDGRRVIKRVHQEDFCQALGCYPAEKYEQHGGPSWRACFDLMNQTADPAAERHRLLQYAIYQHLVGNPDAHAKNYSVLHRSGAMRLAPLYDVNNAFAFRRHFKRQAPRLAMAVGGEFDPTRLTASHWGALAEDISMSRQTVLSELASLAEQIIPAARSLRTALAGTPADCAELDDVVLDIEQRAAAIAGQTPAVEATAALHEIPRRRRLKH